MTKAITHFDTISEIVVVGVNPENADYDNPRGERYGLSFSVRACNDHGDTWVLHVATGERYEEAALEAKAAKLAAALQARLDNLGKLPVGFATWTPGRPIYGSAAYVEYGADEDAAWERRAA